MRFQEMGATRDPRAPANPLENAGRRDGPTITCPADPSSLDRLVGGTNPQCDPELMDVVASSAVQSGSRVREPVPLGASDDAALMIQRVQQRGGLGTYVAIGSEPARSHHSSDFDIDESVIGPTVELLARTIVALGRRHGLKE
jgi:hypothetical protein